MPAVPQPDPRDHLSSPKDKFNAPKESLPKGLEGLSPRDSDFTSIVASVLDAVVKKNHSLEVTVQTVKEMATLGLLRTGAFDRQQSALRKIPYFAEDESLHAKIRSLQDELPLHNTTSLFPKNFASMAADKESVAELSRQIRTAEKALIDKNRAENVQFQEGFVRCTELGEKVSEIFRVAEPESAQILVRALWRARDGLTPLQHLPAIVDHFYDLAVLEDSVRHIRKAYLALCEGSLDLAPAKLNYRLESILADANINTYLGNSYDAERDQAEEWLQSMEGGNYCPPPYPSWNFKKESAVAESCGVVTRARQHSYSFDRYAQETRRLPRQGPSVLAQFATECFEEVKGVYASALEVPPGPGFYLSSAKMDRLFFPDGRSLRGGVEEFKEINAEWLGDAVDHFEDTSFVFCRGMIILFNNHNHFKLDGVSSSYCIYNDHFTSGYECAELIPTEPIVRRLRPCLYNLGEVPPLTVLDVTKQGLTERGLELASQRHKLPPLRLAGISTLFGTCAYAYPPCSSPHFEWEVWEENAPWKDYTGHVHASWKIWNFRNDIPRVDRVLAPLQELHTKVHRVALAYQKLFELFRSRYASWKNDQTPGPKMAPRMLTAAYKWYHHRDALAPEHRPILCLAERHDYGASLIPLIDCDTMRLFRVDGDSRQFLQLPTNTDGSENRENSIWNRHVRPYLYNEGRGSRTEGDKELVLMAREYLDSELIL